MPLRAPLLSLLVSLWIFPFGSMAADADPARRFAELLYGGQYRLHHEYCLRQAGMLSLESLVAQNPDSFPGLKPGSPPWDEIVEAYAAYWETVCGRPGEEEFLETLASAYRTELSPAQMEAAIRFYSGEDGRKLIAAGKIAASQALMAYSRAYSEQVPIAWGKFNRRVQAIFENSVRPDTKPDTK